MNKILVVNVNWMGDVIFSSPVFRAIKEAHPKAHISCMAVPRVREVLESIPCIDEIIEYDEEGRHGSPLAKLKLIFQLRRRHFDVAFLLHRSLTRALLVYFAGIPQRVGYDEKNRGRFLTHKVGLLGDTVHRRDYYLNVIESYGIEVGDRQCQLNVLTEEEKSVAELLKSKNIQKDEDYIVVNPGGNWDLKRWPPENYTSLINLLLTDCNTRVVITGAQKDILLTAKIMSSIFAKHSQRVVNLTGKTSLKQLMALMKRADLVVSGDSGPLHLANGVGSDVVGVFGPTRPEITGPRGSGRSHVKQYEVGCNRGPCYHLTCADNICMQSITAQDVFETIQQIQN